MTAPDQQDTKTSATKALFIGFFGLALGWAGVLVAAVAVATEQYWTKGQPVRDRNTERKQSWLATQKAWLDADHQQRQQQSAAHRDWLNNGSDPATRPPGPSKARKAGAFLRRLVAGTAVAAANFGGGFRDGWQAANERRRGGAGFRDIAAARPGQPAPATRNTSDPDEWLRPDDNEPASVVHEPDTAELLTDDTGHWSWTCRLPDCTGKGFDYPTRQAATEAARTHKHTRPAPAEPQGDPVTSPTVPAQPAPAVPAGDSNATVLAQKLGNVNQTVTAITADVDQLNAVVTTLTAQIQTSADLAHSAGMPTEAIQAVDAARHAAALIGSRLDAFSTGTITASDQLTAAARGLQPVTNAENRLRAAGADGRALDTAAA